MLPVEGVGVATKTLTRFLISRASLARAQKNSAISVAGPRLIMSASATYPEQSLDGCRLQLPVPFNDCVLSFSFAGIGSTM